MISRFDPKARKAGFTLFEALVSLALIALVLAVGVAATRPPSPALRAKAAIAQLNKTASELRSSAITEGRAINWSPEAASCEENQSAEVTFFADGTAKSPVLCLSDRKMQLHPLTGLLLDLGDE